MHRAFAAMGGLPRRAPVPATIALLAPPAPPQSGPNQKKAAAQGPAAGHKCSRCKTRPKSGSGSSLCIRCKLQREYGSPRGGFAAPRKKIPPAAQSSQNAVSPQASATPVASSSAATSPDCPAPTVAIHSPVPAATSSADTVTHLKVEENVQPVETIQLEVAGEPSLRINRSKLRSHRVLTESDWSSLKEELENEKDDFLPEDLNQTIEVELLSGQGLPVNVALPAEIMGTMDTTATPAGRVGIPQSAPVVSLPEVPPEEGTPSSAARSSPEKSLSFLDEARNSIRLYGPQMEAAFDALHASTSQAKWVTVLSVHQKKAVLAKIFERLSDLENKLLFPGERSVVSRLSRSVEQLFNSMKLLRGRMQIPVQQNHNIAQNSVNASNSTPPVRTPTPCGVIPAVPQLSQYSPLDQSTSSFCNRPQAGTALYAYNQPSPSTKPDPEPSFQTAKSLKDEADEEIKKILAKLQSEDRNVTFSGTVPEQPTQMYSEQPPPPPPQPAATMKPMVPQQQPVNRTMFSESNSFNMQSVAIQRSFQAPSAPTYSQMNGGQASHYQVQGLNMWEAPMVPNASLKSCPDPPLVGGAAMRSTTNLVNSAMSNEAFGPTPAKRPFPNQSRQQCPPQMSSGSVASAPQLRNLLARKVTPLPSERPASDGQQTQNYYGSGRLNHAQSQDQLPSGFMSNLNPCNRKPTLPMNNMNSAGLAQPAPNFPAGNNFPSIYTTREHLVQQPQQYHVQAHHNGPSLSLAQNSDHVPVNSQQPTGPQNGRGPLQGLAIHPQLQQVDQVISNESFTAQWSGSNLGVFNLQG